MSNLPKFLPIVNNLNKISARALSGGYGDGAGKGGGSGGAVRDAGGAFGKMEAAREEEYFYKKQKAQLEELKKHISEEIKHHEKQLDNHKKAPKLTLALLKPEVVAHPPLLKEVVIEFMKAGITIVSARRLHLDKQKAIQLYGAHDGKFFYPRLIRHICSGPVVALGVVGDVRAVLGSSKLWPLTQNPTLRQRLALSDARNVAHNSDSATADAELALFAPYKDPSSILKEILDI